MPSKDFYARPSTIRRSIEALTMQGNPYAKLGYTPNMPTWQEWQAEHDRRIADMKDKLNVAILLHGDDL